MPNNKKNLLAEATLQLQIASSYFYLGDLQSCENAAVAARQLATRLEDPKIEIKSLYLSSAAYRGQGDQRAITTAKDALALCREHLPDDKGLTAKVLFNLGAAESDLNPKQLTQANAHLREAGRLFNDVNQPDDALKVGLRLTRVQYLQGQYKAAEKTMMGLDRSPKTPRNEMLYWYQLAKVEHRLERWQEAENHVDKASQLARQLNAKKDFERISDLKEAVAQRRFVVE